MKGKIHANKVMYGFFHYVFPYSNQNKTKQNWEGLFLKQTTLGQTSIRHLGIILFEKLVTLLGLLFLNNLSEDVSTHQTPTKKEHKLIGLNQCGSDIPSLEFSVL